uniref:Uncharacterized protein n=1 Tax=Strongyloides venezuelensis TaxID=75913 RepID=A0A0K0EYU9_STRVS
MGYIVFYTKYIFPYNNNEINNFEVILYNKKNNGVESSWDIKLIVLAELAFVHTCGLVFLTIISRNFVICYIIFILSILLGFHYNEILNFFTIPIDEILLVVIVGVACFIKIISISFKKTNFIKNIFVMEMAILLTINQLKIWPYWGWWIPSMVISFCDIYLFLKNMHIPLEDSFEGVRDDLDDISYLLTYTCNVNGDKNDFNKVDNPKIIKKTNNKNEINNYKPQNCLIGEFICYSLLIGYISMFNEWNLIIICYISMVVGIFLTREFQDLYGNSLPHLAGPTIFSLSMFFLARIFISPFIFELFKCIPKKIYFI